MSSHIGQGLTARHKLTLVDVVVAYAAIKRTYDRVASLVRVADERISADAPPGADCWRPFRHTFQQQMPFLLRRRHIGHQLCTTALALIAEHELGPDDDLRPLLQARAATDAQLRAVLGQLDARLLANEAASRIVPAADFAFSGISEVARPERNSRHGSHAS
jgi:hypothetical protein